MEKVAVYASFKNQNRKSIDFFFKTNSRLLSYEKL